MDPQPEEYQLLPRQIHGPSRPGRCRGSGLGAIRGGRCQRLLCYGRHLRRGGRRWRLDSISGPQWWWPRYLRHRAPSRSWCIQMAVLLDQDSTSWRAIWICIGPLWRRDRSTDTPAPVTWPAIPLHDQLRRGRRLLHGARSRAEHRE